MENKIFLMLVILSQAYAKVVNGLYVYEKEPFTPLTDTLWYRLSLFIETYSPLIIITILLTTILLMLILILRKMPKDRVPEKRQ